MSSITTANASSVDIAPVRGVAESVDASSIVLAIPNTDYRLHLQIVGGGYATAGIKVGESVRGVIRANARRIDVSNQGGGFIDPVYGRPRNIQGRVSGTVPDENALVIKTAVPMVIRVRAPQQLSDFRTGQMVVFAVDPGATLTPALTP